MKTSNKYKGDLGEKAAIKFLRRKHYKILAQNIISGHLELDIVAATRHEIVFVEVKTRSLTSLDSDAYGTAAMAVDREKKRNTVNAAYAYLRKHPSLLQPRIDVIEVYIDKSPQNPKILKINHFENAVTKRDI